MRNQGDKNVLNRIVTDEEGLPQFYRGRNGKYVSVVPNKIMLIKDADGTETPYTLYFWQINEETQGGRYVTLEEVERLKRQAKNPPELIPNSLVHSIQ